MAKFYPIRSGWVSVGIALLSGLIFGTVAKLADESGIPGVGIIGSYFGVWIVFVALIAHNSSTWWRAVLYALIFLLTMITAYYLTQMLLFGFFATSLFLIWVAIALILAPPLAALIAHAHGAGWVSALGAALPVGLLFHEAYSLRWRLAVNEDYLILFMFDIICAVILLLFLARDRLQRVRAMLLVPIIMIVANVGFNRILPLVFSLLQRVSRGAPTTVACIAWH